LSVPFVLGYLPQHDFEATQLLIGRRLRGQIGFGLVVLRRKIGWHGPAQGHSAPALQQIRVALQGGFENLTN
jgi:hypothetical protein